MIRATISRISFWLAILFTVGLVIGLLVEIAMHHLIFEGYIGGFSAWAFIFAIINAVTRDRRK